MSLCFVFSRTKVLQTTGKEKETGRYLHKSLPLGRLRASSVCARLIAIFLLFRLLSAVVRPVFTIGKGKVPLGFPLAGKFYVLLKRTVPCGRRQKPSRRPVRWCMPP